MNKNFDLYDTSKKNKADTLYVSHSIPDHFETRCNKALQGDEAK